MPLFIPEGEYVTAAEAARMLGLSKPRVSELTTSGDLPSIGTGGTRLIRIEAVRVFGRNRVERERAALERRQARFQQLLTELLGEGRRR